MDRFAGNASLYYRKFGNNNSYVDLYSCRLADREEVVHKVGYDEVWLEVYTAGAEERWTETLWWGDDRTASQEGI